MHGFFKPKPMLPTVLLVWRHHTGGAFITETDIDSSPDADPIANAVSAWLELPGGTATGAKAWTLEKAILLDTLTLAARDVTAAFFARLHSQAVEACNGDEDNLTGWIFEADYICQSRGFDPVVAAWGPRQRRDSPLTARDYL